jgi:hypothetical protein
LEFHVVKEYLLGYDFVMPRKDIEFPVAITVRLDKATYETLSSLAKADRRPPATVARILIQVLCTSMGNRPLHEILAAFPPAKPKK